jgi:hypothetical protein
MSKLKLFLLGTPQLEINGTLVDLERRKALYNGPQNLDTKKGKKCPIIGK